MIRYITDVPPTELAGKKILVRVDFNVPVENGRIAESFRITAVQDTIDYLIKCKARVAMVSHITAQDSFVDLIPQIEALFGQKLFFAGDVVGQAAADMLDDHQIILCDNIRRFSGEEDNASEFAGRLAAGFDMYVNDAFAVSHRRHASVAAITKSLWSYGGFLIRREIEHLSKAIQAPATGKVLILGGAKIATKTPVIEHFLDKAEYILIGGAIANTFLKARGLSVGQSLVDDEMVALEHVNSAKIILPEDVVVAETPDGGNAQSVAIDGVDSSMMIGDVGPRTVERFVKYISNAQMVVWNGPLGLYEKQPFRQATSAIADAVSQRPYSLIGGGDTIAAVDHCHLLDKISYVSTGGGAMLDFLANKKLPGLEALGYYEV